MTVVSSPSYRKRQIKLMTREEIVGVHPDLQQIISYRKSGLSLNHIIGCPLNCGYCVRHFQNNFEMKTPQMLCTDDEAISILLQHEYFTPHRTPLLIFNKATDPFVPGVRPHTHYVLQELDRRGLTNHIAVITRAKVTQEDMEELERLRNLKVTLFFTYSGITDPRIEPIAPTGITVRSIETASRYHDRTKVILYWRPIVPGWNDDEATMRRVLEVGKLVDGIVFTGYYNREENARYLKDIGVHVPYEEFQRRKVMPAELDRNVVKVYKESGVETPLFRKTSCGASYVHGLPDYNGHWGIRELCDICPLQQQQLCDSAYKTPSPQEFEEVLSHYGFEADYLIEETHVWTEGLGVEKRYPVQHALAFQTWDVDWPHFKYQHGRAPAGYNPKDEEIRHWIEVRQQLHREDNLYDDD